MAGAVSPALGVHVLLKLVGGAGEDLGECVVPLTHLLGEEEGLDSSPYIEVRRPLFALNYTELSLTILN